MKLFDLKCFDIINSVRLLIINYCTILNDFKYSILNVKLSENVEIKFCSVNNNNKQQT